MKSRLLEKENRMLSKKLDDSKNNAHYYVHLYILLLMYALVNFS